jgi:hypothetical protein
MLWASEPAFVERLVFHNVPRWVDATWPTQRDAQRLPLITPLNEASVEAMSLAYDALSLNDELLNKSISATPSNALDPLEHEQGVALRDLLTLWLGSITAMAHASGAVCHVALLREQPRTGTGIINTHVRRGLTKLDGDAVKEAEQARRQLAPALALRASQRMLATRLTPHELFDQPPLKQPLPGATPVPWCLDELALEDGVRSLPPWKTIKTE